ncbi:hypothetical protein ABW19_dt0201770 [Dactylella cylindrospora]|nr:hypothetical protein ABW19_dt0201770 [Dactylella cylindrospora]
MESRKIKLTPISSAACITLVETALQKARVEQNDDDDGASGTSTGLTLDLSHQKIGHIPPEVASMIVDEVERLALGQNLLTAFEPEFALCSRLRYLNVRSNMFREFPAVVGAPQVA